MHMWKRASDWHVQAEQLDLIGKSPDRMLHVVNERFLTTKGLTLPGDDFFLQVENLSVNLAREFLVHI